MRQNLPCLHSGAYLLPSILHFPGRMFEWRYPTDTCTTETIICSATQNAHVVTTAKVLSCQVPRPRQQFTNCTCVGSCCTRDGDCPDLDSGERRHSMASLIGRSRKNGSLREIVTVTIAPQPRRMIYSAIELEAPQPYRRTQSCSSLASQDAQRNHAQTLR